MGVTEIRGQRATKQYNTITEAKAHLRPADERTEYFEETEGKFINTE